ncbi:uncharacterized protein Bfra_011097, partial [Botrytis fragariae]
IISDLQPREQEKAFVASKLKVSSITSENEQLLVTATSFDDSRTGTDTITKLSSELPSIADSGLKNLQSLQAPELFRQQPSYVFLIYLWNFESEFGATPFHDSISLS